MTTQEIIKALRCCSYLHKSAKDCDDCPCVDSRESCRTLDTQAADMLEAQAELIDALRNQYNKHCKD